MLRPLSAVHSAARAVGVGVLLLSAVAARGGRPEKLHISRARQINFTHVMTDGKGYRWDIQYYGNIGQGSDYAYGSGAYCQVEGNNINSSGRGWIDADGDEVEIGPSTLNNVRCSRRIRVYKEEGLCRWLDIFENPTGSDIELGVRVYSYFNWGIGQMRSNSGGEFGEKDWAFYTVPQGGPPNRPHVLQIVCSPRSKVRPDVTRQHNQIYVNYRVTVPANGTAILCYFHSQNRSTDRLEKMMKKFRARKYLDDLPISVRRLIVNFRGGGFGLNFDLQRSEHFDTVLLNNEDPLYGKVLNQAFLLETEFGEIRLPAKDVVGMVTADLPDRSMVRVGTRDGQILLGRLTSGPIEVNVPAAGVLRVSPAGWAQWSYRLRTDEPETPPFDGPYVILRNGQRLAYDPARTPLEMRTIHGAVPLPSQQLGRVDFQGEALGLHRAVFRNGSRLGGILEPDRLEFHLRLGPKAAFARPGIGKVVFLPEVEEDRSLSKATLINGDELLGRVAEQDLSLETGFGTVPLPVEMLRALASVKGRTGQVSVVMWDGSSHTGKLLQPEIRFELAEGVELGLSPARIATLVRSGTLPPKRIADRVAELVGMLAAESQVDRDRARKELLRLGPGVAQLLRKHRERAGDAALQSHIDAVLETWRERDAEEGNEGVPVNLFIRG